VARLLPAAVAKAECFAGATAEYFVAQKGQRPRKTEVRKQSGVSLPKSEKMKRRA